ncbi:protein NONRESPONDING TO OXYLIPINS 2, mitochondrial-like isoform X2 [Magnolia sinica]|uniref:protein NONRESPONDING TO OXYLIPINS 2, mitochondrial-like isoform X2 n=1 Tax=Magnolia sinica TaxID=86752 RepID=UPI002658F8E9|nr:protein NONRESPONDING TO OXYLIPINS 2, mitochondrial-like isoform X2 [Magnolia sinica]
MAAPNCWSKLINRTSLSSLKSAIKSKKVQTPLDRSTPHLSPTRPTPLPAGRFSSISRSPAELACAQSLLPLHSAVATARLTSCLTSSSRSCRALSQEFGLSVPR